jgi:hypothetical protein
MVAGDIEQALPTLPATTQAIYDYWKRRGSSEYKRGYLGISAIGAECSRFLWYSFRHATAEEFDGRMYRLFNRGHREEAVIAEELRGIGCEVIMHDENGNQIGFSDLGGHFRGHMDAAVLGVPEAPKTWHVGEFKTSSSKLFSQMQKEGVEKSKPVHYAQMQLYMHYSGMTRALYVMVNKDNDEIYTERIRYDGRFAETMISRAKRIITASTPPARIAERRDDFRCRFCPAKSLCHGPLSPTPAVPLPSLSCRQCVHATPELDSNHGRWSCAKHNKTLSRNDQDNPCKSLLLIPEFITFAHPETAFVTDEGEDVIEFKNIKDGAVWYHGPDSDAGHYAAKDLMSMPVELIESGLKQRVNGNKISTDLVAKYEDAMSVLSGLSEALEAEWARMFKGEIDIKEPIQTVDYGDYQVAEYPGDILLICVGEMVEVRIIDHPDNDAFRHYFPSTK